MRGYVREAGTGLPLAGVSIKTLGNDLPGVTTGSDGSYRLAGVPEGSQTLEFTLVGYQGAIANVEIQIGSVVFLPAVELAPEAAYGMVAGVVTDAETGAVLSGISISVSGASSVSVTTDASGAYSIGGVEPGDVVLAASGEGYVKAEAQGTVVGGGVLRFSPAMNTVPKSELKGSLAELGTGEAIEGALVELSSGESVASAADGSFGFADLEAGVYEVSISAEGYVGLSISVLVPEGTAVEIGKSYLDVETTSVTLVGTVTDAASGEPLAGAMVEVREAGLSVKTDADGYYRLEGMEAGEFTVRYSSVGYNSVLMGYGVSAGGLYEENVSLEESLAGKVRVNSVSTDRQEYGAREEVIIEAVVENLDEQALPVYVMAELGGPDGIMVTSVPPVSSVDMELGAGESASVQFVWNTENYEAGSYEVSVKVYSGESSHIHGNTPEVLAIKAGAMRIREEKDLFGALRLDPPATTLDFSDEINITAAVRNMGNVPLGGTLRVTAGIEGETVYTNDVSLDQLDVNGVKELGLGSFVPSAEGDYTVELTALGAEGELLASAANSFEIVGTASTGEGLTGTLTLAPNPVKQGQDEVAEITISNRGNEDIGGVVASLVVANAETGEPKLERSVSLGDIALGATVEDSMSFDTSTLDVGMYLVILRAKGSEMTEARTLGSLPLEVEPGINITAALSTGEPEYTAHETVEVVLDITNEPDSMPVENVLWKLDLTGEDGTVYETFEETIPAMTIGETASFSPTWDAGSNAPGNYLVSVTVTYEGEVMAEAKAGFEVIGTTITGAGIEGSVSASPEVVRQGLDLKAVYTAENEGNEDVPGLDIRAYVEEGLMASDTLDLDLHDMAAGELAFDTWELEPGDYTLELRAQGPVMLNELELDTAEFEVLPPVEVTKSGFDMKHLLVWLDYNWRSGRSVPDLAVIEGALRQSGMSYTIVYDKKDFQAELRSPFYTDYLILGDRQPLENHYVSELREKVNMGAGLVVSMFTNKRIDLSVFGIKNVGKLKAGRYPLIVEESEVTSAGETEIDGRVLRLELVNDAEAFGWVEETAGGGKKKAATPVYHPVAVRGVYGEGRALFYGLELGMLSVENPQAFAELLLGSLSHVHRPRPEAGEGYPYGIAAYGVRLENLGTRDVEIELKESYPVDSSLYDYDEGVWLEDNPQVYEFKLGGGETRNEDFLALLPDMNGEAGYSSRVRYLYRSEYRLIAEEELGFKVRSVGVELEEAIAGLAAMAVSAAEVDDVEEALVHLEYVRARVVRGSQNMEENIHDLVMAIEILLGVESADTSEIVRSLDKLLSSWQGRWYLQR